MISPGEMMMTADLFNALRQIIPEIPERTTKLTIHIECHAIPVVKCEFFPTFGSIETVEKQFTLHELNKKESHVVERSRTAADTCCNPDGNCAIT